MKGIYQLRIHKRVRLAYVEWQNNDIIHWYQ